MKVLLLVLCFFGVTCRASPNVTFDAYVKIYHKIYSKDVNEYSKRLNFFQENLVKSRHFNLNRTSDSAYYGVTKFSDMSSEEFKKKYLSCYQTQYRPTPEPIEASYASPLKSVNPNIPKRIDWRNNPSSACKHAVSPVNNQKTCGACWAFAAVETVESMHAVKTGNLRALSVQQVIDCSRGYQGLKGCAGGGTCLAFQWMKDRQKALVPAKEYPTVDKTQKCKLPPTVHQGVTINNFTCDNFVTAEERMLEALVRGPITVGVDATNWQNYQRGIIQYHCGQTMNHAVQIVGYDISGDVPYYIVRNSWGTDFGQDGYLYIKYGENVCGVAQEVSAVNVLGTA